jgi:hypothetical protein
MPSTLRTIAALSLLTAAGLFLQNCGRNGLDASSGRYKPVASVDQIMDGIVIPSSSAIFDSVVYENGELVASPMTDEDWFTLQMHALAIAEAGNLLVMPPRARDEGDWVTFSHAMTDLAVLVAQAAESKDSTRLLEWGSEMYRTCTDCHAKYLDQP